MTEIGRRRLGAAGPEVSEVALGSWRTFERIPREMGVAVLTRARELGIDFLDDARYDDETGSAPIPSGYSEVLFGELFRAAGFSREETLVSEKLWWEFWPEQSAAQELDGSLERLQFDYVDLIYAVTLPPALDIETAVAQVAMLLRAGKARHWGVAMWQAADIEAACAAADAEGIARPCAAQMAYSFAERATAANPAMLAALGECGVGLVASAPLAGGVLSGKYADERSGGRHAGDLGTPERQKALRAGDALRELAAEWGTNATALAVAFALDHPHVSAALLGATSPAQLEQAAVGSALRASLSEEQLGRLREWHP
ncbi:MAG TPA: aldo/keto reductase [Solirubrobacteraceae bacterium]|nr:aldo/keto reductase [Solirubrobacteraceae bacterium]